MQHGVVSKHFAVLAFVPQNGGRAHRDAYTRVFNGGIEPLAACIRVRGVGISSFRGCGQPFLAPEAYALSPSADAAAARDCNVTVCRVCVSMTMQGVNPLARSCCLGSLG